MANKVILMRHATKERTIDPRARVTSVAGAEVMLQLCKQKIYELIHRGELQSYTDGRTRRVTVVSIDKYIERQLADATFRRERYQVRAPPDA